jgi:purine-nucleoside phosphorylase
LRDRVTIAGRMVQQVTGRATADVAVILSSRLGAAADRMSDLRTLEYGTIPGFPETAVAGNPGRLLVGRWGRLNALVFCGRVHAFEGYPPSDLGFGVRLAAVLGARTLVVTDVAGALDPSIAVGDVVLVSDHLNLTGVSPLAGPNDEHLGPRLVAMADTYDLALRSIAATASNEALGRQVREGVYAAMSGPSYETPAEARMLRLLGADLVGMSLVHETTVARHAGVKSLGLVVVGSLASGEGRLAHKEIIQVASQQASTLGKLLDGIMLRLPDALEN